MKTFVALNRSTTNQREKLTKVEVTLLLNVIETNASTLFASVYKLHRANAFELFGYDTMDKFLIEKLDFSPEYVSTLMSAIRLFENLAVFKNDPLREYKYLSKVNLDTFIPMLNLDRTCCTLVWIELTEEMDLKRIRSSDVKNAIATLGLEENTTKPYAHITDDYVCNLVEGDLQKFSNVLLSCAENDPKLYKRLVQIASHKLDDALNLY